MSTLRQIIDGVRLVGRIALDSVDAPPASVSRTPRAESPAASVDDSCSVTPKCLLGHDHEGNCVLGKE